MAYNFPGISFFFLILFSFQHAPANNDFRIFALNHYGDQLCAIEINEHHSIPACFEPAVIEQHLKSNQTFLEKQYLSDCPEPWLEQKSCSLKKIRKTSIRPNPFITLYNDLIKHPIQQMFFFIHNSLDDLVEDFFALGIPAITGVISYSLGLGKYSTFMLVVCVHTLSSPLGDKAGDWIQQYQRGIDCEKELEWQLCEIIANKIEDSIKTAFISVCYGNIWVIRTLEQYYYPRSLSGAESSHQVSKTHNIAMMFLLTLDTYQFFERYNWLNEIADAIADIFTERCRQGN